MKSVRKIELLAPARNAETGIEAILHGADAVYIGAPKFGARSAAANSLKEIQQLVDFAHLYQAKVYVALNTILTDPELPEAEKIIRDLYRSNVDAVIIQDMGILKLDLPPIPFHASTQTDNRTVEKVQFLENAGFSRVILARELPIETIRTIAQNTHIPLEVFVHGALCTSFSGQCYISQALSGRSANRGECAQYCRMLYSLSDAEGTILSSNKHLLSLKDLNLSDHLEELLDANVTSLKIEGRLKDMAYVKNVTAYYRKKLDSLFERRPEFQAASSGKTIPYFVPDPYKSFNRGFTTYFLHGRNKTIASSETPKSTGEPVGNVNDLSSNYFTIKGQKTIHNGDGLCFLNDKKELQGFRVNRVDGNKIYPAEMPRINPGVALFRNQNHEFEKILSKKSAERKIKIDLLLEENNFGFNLSVVDEDAYSASITLAFTKELSNKDQRANIREQLSKFGNTPFVLDQFQNRLSENWFIPSSVLSEMRRKITDALLSVRKIAFLSFARPTLLQTENSRFPVEQTLTYRNNVANDKARTFYRQYGAERIEPAFEIKPPTNVPLMFTKHCLKYQLGYCPKTNEKGLPLKEPLTLLTGKNRLMLKFDCFNCEMHVL